MQNMREAAANAGASARAGFEKAKATVQGQADKMRANDPNEKEMARERKEGRLNEAECKKQQARDQNAQAKHTGGHGYTTGAPGGNTGAGYTGTTGYNTGYAGDNRGDYAYGAGADAAAYPIGRDSAADYTAADYRSRAPVGDYPAGTWGTNADVDNVAGHGGSTGRDTRTGADVARGYATGTGGNYR